MLLTSLRMRPKSSKAFRKMVSRNVSNTSTVASRSVQLHKRIFFFCRKCNLHVCTIFYFSEIKWFRGHFEGIMYSDLNYLPFKAYQVFYVPTGLTFKNSTWCSLFGWAFYTDLRTESCFCFIRHKLVFITVVKGVYSAARTDSLYKAEYVSFLEG
jgi:hypothetical protein